MNSKYIADKQDIKDFKTIQRELTRANKPPTDKDRLNNLNTRSQYLKSPKFGESDIRKNHAVVGILTKLAKRQLGKRFNEHRITLEEFRDCLEESFYNYAVNGGLDEPKNIVSIIEEASISAKRLLQDYEFFFPLVTATCPDFSEINLGNIKILSAEVALNSLATKDAEVVNELSALDVPSANAYISIALKGYSKNAASDRATNCLNIILGMLYALFIFHRRNYTFLFSLQHPQPVLNKHVVVSSEGNLSLEEDYKRPGGFGNILTLIKDDFTTELGEALKELLQISLESTTNSLADRLLDAFFWLSEAVRDPNQNAQTVKLSSALERLVTLKIEKDEKNVTSYFVARVTLLLNACHTDIRHSNKWAKDFYRRRSDLVHGSASVYKPQSDTAETENLRNVVHIIFSACIGFKHFGLQRDNYEIELKEWYRKLEAFSKLPSKA